MSDSVEARLVEEELAELPRDIIEGAYRSLCAAMLLRTYTELATAKALRKDALAARRVCHVWLFRGGGIISFAEACDACNIRTRVFLDHVVEAADNPDSRPNNKWRLQANRVVFGRQANASAVEIFDTDPSGLGAGMVSGGESADRSCGRAAWSATGVGVPATDAVCCS